MKRRLASVLIVGLFSISILGCGDKSTATKETTISTPGRTTTVTEEKDVTTKGENPPSEQP